VITNIPGRRTLSSCFIILSEKVKSRGFLSSETKSRMRMIIQPVCLLVLLSFIVATIHATSIGDQDVIEFNQTQEIQESGPDQNERPSWWTVATAVVIFCQDLIGMYGALFVLAILSNKAVRMVFIMFTVYFLSFLIRF